MSNPADSKAKQPAKRSSADPRAFKAVHYKRIAIGFAALVIGFLLLASEPFVDATQFSISLWVAPLIILGAYIWIGVSILHTPKSETNVPNAGNDSDS